MSSRPRRRRWPISGVLLSAALTVLLSTAAGAQPGTPRDRARARVEEGIRLYDAGNFAAALATFQDALAIFPSPKIHYNVALAYEGMGKNAQAFTAFERFLREATDARPEYVTDARKKLERLSKRVAFVSISCDTDEAEVLVDGALMGATPLPGRLPVDTGPHDVVVRGGTLGSRSRSFTAVAGESIELKIDLRPASPLAVGPPVASAPLPDPGRRPAIAAPGHASADTSPSPGGRRAWLPVARWSTAGAAALALGTGVYFNVRGNSKQDEFDNFMGPGSPPQKCGVDGSTIVGGTECENLSRQYDSAKRNATIAYVAGGALGATAVVLFLIGREPVVGESALVPGAGASPIGVTYAGRF